MDKQLFFSDAYKDINGYLPFPWQVRLFNQVMDSGWPKNINLPTGSGKTSVMDIAVLSLAAGAEVPRRIFMIVDRRIVVDDAYGHAKTIKDKILAETTSTLKKVKQALLLLGGISPLEVAVLRGGIYREDNWVRHPAQPVLVCSTVDQVGSRLLHQGYGVSPGMRSVHAGMLSYDALHILDEAHCSEPFRQTLDWINKYRQVTEVSIQKGLLCVNMTATPRDRKDLFSLSDEDRNHPVLQKRLTAKKFLKPVLIPEKTPIEDVIIKMLESVPLTGRTILVIVNRVLSARLIAESLIKASSRSKNPLPVEEPLVLTGRARMHEREEELAKWEYRIKSGRNRSEVASEKGLIVVSTQTIEVGADIDADYLITEICPVDVLKQRLGRLDRLGELGISSAICLIPEKLDKMKTDSIDEDPVYGAALYYAWKWLKALLNDNDSIDVGIDAWDHYSKEMKSDVYRQAQSPSADAPVIYPDYIDLWVQTNPTPEAVPEPSLFLHGPERGDVDIQFVWRADLGEDYEKWADIISVIPPMTGETLSVPIQKAKEWLSQKAKKVSDLSDIEGPLNRENSRSNQESAFSYFLNWKGREKSFCSQNIGEIQPGDTIVLPCAYGGCDKWGWNPIQSSDSDSCITDDIAVISMIKSKRELTLRLHNAFIEQLPPEFTALPFEQSDDVVDTIRQRFAEALERFKARVGEKYSSPMEKLLVSLSGKSRFEVFPHPSGSGWYVTEGRRNRKGLHGFTTTDETASVLSRNVKLADHSKHVKDELISIIEHLNIAERIKADMIKAAKFHDIGKADPRFQSLLCGGNMLLAKKTGLLAKSSSIIMDKQQYLYARKKSGYPDGARHEVLSVHMIQNNKELLESVHDKDLFRFLILSHHGRGRPFIPITDDISPVTVHLETEGLHFSALSSGFHAQEEKTMFQIEMAEIFWRLIRKYGWWGLSYLEACFRLADHRASELEQEA